MSKIKLPKWKGLSAKEIKKADKAYRKEIKRGLQPKQAQRNARGKATGKSKRASQGHKEDDKQPVTDIKTRSKGLITSEWNLYSFISYMVKSGTNTRRRDYSLRFSVVCGDINQINNNYNSDTLFALHQFFENESDDYFGKSKAPFSVDRITQDEIYHDNEYRPIKSELRNEFVFQIFDESQDRQFYIKYANGKITKSSMWDYFDLIEFLILIKQFGNWE